MLNIFSLLNGAESATPKGSGWMLLGYIVFIFGFMYLITIRPQKKKQKAANEMRSAIEVGDWILTVGGFYGKIIEKVNDVFIVEFGTNKSVRIPIKRDAIASKEEPELRINRDEEIE